SRRSRPPQSGQANTSMANTRRSKSGTARRASTVAGACYERRSRAGRAAIAQVQGGRNAAVDLAPHVVFGGVLAVSSFAVEVEPEAHVVAHRVSDHVALISGLDSIAHVLGSGVPHHGTALHYFDSIASVVVGHVVADDAVTTRAQANGVAESVHV